MENTDLNVNNTAAELVKATQLVRACGKKNATNKKRAGGNLTGTDPYKQGLEERMAKCQALITQSTMDANAPTLQGSPNDDPMTGGSPQTPERLSEGIPDARAAAAQQDPPIDPALNNSEPPPAKKGRANDGQPMHRKINSIPGRIISAFTTAWREDEIQVQKADPSLGAEGFGNLYQAAIEIMDRVKYTAEKAGLSYEDLKWNITYTDGGAVQVSDLIALRQWLIASGAMVDDIQPASVPALAVKKVSAEPTIKIWVDMDNDFGDDDRSPEGPQSVSWSGREKCVSCDSVRGKALESRPAPHPDDGEFLAQCKCPLQGAALELWMIKMTAEMEGIPQRGAIQAVYGHQVETLLQPEVDRLEFAVHWALKELTLYAARDDSQYAASFPLLLTQFKQTMVAWEKEQEEDRARKN
ncbi:hypothetical protein B0H16DRAFT_1735334 [Mycena metata]|uniref:Uncharacterized protein n=1 Tax=Mycena metata TaxID=1033252 RepID=A0AAD7HTW2_9AGAR|nr:hypothetical protein B0H16DRAFT_1735334 [Mycena metata]